MRVHTTLGRLPWLPIEASQPSLFSLFLVCGSEAIPSALSCLTGVIAPYIHTYIFEFAATILDLTEDLST